MRAALVDIPGFLAPGVGVGFRIPLIQASGIGLLERVACHWFGSLQAPTLANGYDAGAPRYVPIAAGPLRVVVQVFQATMAQGGSASHPVPQRIDTP